jgi:hypothetical protein
VSDDFDRMTDQEKAAWARKLHWRGVSFRQDEAEPWLEEREKYVKRFVEETLEDCKAIEGQIVTCIKQRRGVYHQERSPVDRLSLLLLAILP